MERQTRSSHNEIKKHPYFLSVNDNIDFEIRIKHLPNDSIDDCHRSFFKSFQQWRSETRGAYRMTVAFQNHYFTNPRRKIEGFNLMCVSYLLTLGIFVASSSQTNEILTWL